MSAHWYYVIPTALSREYEALVRFEVIYRSYLLRALDHYLSSLIEFFGVDLETTSSLYVQLLSHKRVYVCLLLEHDWSILCVLIS